jgi:HK97 family phage prohead protease
MAVGIIKNWAAGHDGHGNKVSSVVQAAAAKAVAQWERDKASGGKASRAVTQVAERAQMSTGSIDDLPDSDFAVIESGGSKDASGKTTPRSLRHLPIHDAAHVRDALSRLPQTQLSDADKSAARKKIMAAAKKFGVDAGDSDDGESRSDVQAFDGFLVRSFPLEDMHILRSGDGRTVEAYAAVWDTEAEIRDGQGHYREVIDRSAFNRAVDKARPQGSRNYWLTRCFYNHGMTLHGTPSERFSVPLGVTQDVRVESRGLLTVTRYNNSPLADEILEAVRTGSITGQSFTGRIVRSDPMLRPGQMYRGRGADLPIVRRMELGLTEYGPTPTPYYADAEIVGVRAALAEYGTAARSPIRYVQADDEEQQEDPGPPPEEDGLAPAGEGQPEPELAGHSALVGRMRSLSVTRGVSWKRGVKGGNP